MFTKIAVKEDVKLEKTLRFEITRNEISVAKLAKLSQVPAKTIFNWLSGQTPKDIKQLMRVAEVLEVTLDQLCYGRVATQSPDGTLNPIESYASEINAGVFEVILRRQKPK